MSGGICDRGWDMKSVKGHVEDANNMADSAQNTAEYAKDLAEHNAGDIESIEERLAKLEGKRNE